MCVVIPVCHALPIREIMVEQGLFVFVCFGVSLFVSVMFVANCCNSVLLRWWCGVETNVKLIVCLLWFVVVLFCVSVCFL